MPDIFWGDCVETLNLYPDNYFDSSVTDPPYAYGMDGDNWDSSAYVSSFREDLWEEVFRVLKPGAFLATFCGARTYHRVASSIEKAGFRIVNQLAWIYAQGNPKKLDRLKPALEPICLAQKPGDGELNIKACRFPVRGIAKPKFPEGNYSVDSTVGNIRSVYRKADSDPTTRFPSNVIISDEELLGEKAPYFFCAKPTAEERAKVSHKTLKTLRLMRWLVRLVTPPGGILLEPFLGSGTTAIACLEQGTDFVGIELKKNHFLEARDRIQTWLDKPTVDLNDPIEKLKKDFESKYG